MKIIHRLMWPVYRLLDAIVKLTLRSPLHFLLSWQFIVLEFTGVRTGRRYRLAAHYLRKGNETHTMVYRRRLWWRNLRGGREIKVLYKGRRFQAKARVEEDDLAVIAAGLREREVARRLLFRVTPEASVMIIVELGGS